MLVSPWVDAALAGVLGLLVGSFLNVVIYRLPRMLERQWAAECAELQNVPVPQEESFNLMRPRSRCPHCGHAIRWYENIPVLSYMALRGKCSACGGRIGLRYPIVEAITGALFALCAHRWGLGAQAALWAAFGSLLICLSLIDFDTQLLPDDLNYPLLWLGLLAASFGFTVPLRSAVWGAVLGYLSLWSVYQLFKLTTGKEGMGYGDFKLLAALGAWFGMEFLLPLILLSSVVGAVLGVTMLVVGKLADRSVPMPFGPFLAGAGLLCLLVTPQAMPELMPFAFPFG